MRTKTVALLSLLGLAALAACSASQDDADSAASAQTDDDMARGALRTLGAKLPNEDRSNATCQNCHDPNKLTLKKWAESFNTTIAFISDESKSADERINFMRRNPEDPGHVHGRLRRPRGPREGGEVDELAGGQQGPAHADVRVHQRRSAPLFEQTTADGKNMNLDSNIR